MDTYELTIRGIPCVILYKWVQGSRGAYIGTVQIEPDESAHAEIYGLYTISRGRRNKGNWLSKRLTSEERYEILDDIERYHKEC